MPKLLILEQDSQSSTNSSITDQYVPVGLREEEEEGSHALELRFAKDQFQKAYRHAPRYVARSPGRVNLIGPMCLAAVAAGADGIIVEVHLKPEEALCDADQALTPAIFADIMDRLRPLRTFMDKLPV